VSKVEAHWRKIPEAACLSEGDERFVEARVDGVMSADGPAKEEVARSELGRMSGEEVKPMTTAHLALDPGCETLEVKSLSYALAG
jgi:hypothetical protein